MDTSNLTTIVEVFPDRSKAEYAVAELLRNGFKPEHVGFVLSSGEDLQSFAAGSTKAVQGAEAGAAAGIALGGLAGVVLGSIILPGAGTVIAGGLLAGLLEGAAVGATSGSVLGALIGMSVPENEARIYERDFHSGQTLVTVRADGRYNEAVAILKHAQDRVEPTGFHHGRGRLAALAGDDSSSTDGSGKAFVPQP